MKIIIKISIIKVFTKLPLEKLLFFLEKLQNSKGYTNYETRTNKRLRVSLIPKKETIKIV
jgi:hypothetical protein